MAGQAKWPMTMDWDNEAFMRSLSRQILKRRNITEAMVKKTAIYVQNKAKDYAAVDTGYMRSNIFTEEGRDERGFFVAIHSRALYWIFVEFGTRNMNAQPFMRPAFAEGKTYLLGLSKAAAL